MITLTIELKMKARRRANKVTWISEPIDVRSRLALPSELSLGVVYSLPVCARRHSRRASRLCAGEN